MKSLTRRQFISSSTALAVISPSLLLTSQTTAAAETPRVDPDEAQAKALSYVHESPNAENICGNCQRFTGPADAAWGPCAIFPGKHVAGAGWCSAWAEKAG